MTIHKLCKDIEHGTLTLPRLGAEYKNSAVMHAGHTEDHAITTMYYFIQEHAHQEVREIAQAVYDARNTMYSSVVYWLLFRVLNACAPKGARFYVLNNAYGFWPDAPHAVCR